MRCTCTYVYVSYSHIVLRLVSLNMFYSFFVWLFFMILLHTSQTSGRIYPDETEHFATIYYSNSFCVCFCVSMDVCDVCVCVQSLSPKPVYLWLPSEVAGWLPAGQSHRDKRCALHQPTTARQQTNWTNQEQEVPLLRYKHTHTTVLTQIKQIHITRINFFISDHPHMYHAQI